MTKKLLLADDSITIQKVIGIIFATEDYELHVCDDGNEAFDKALAEYPDLVIADVSMPGKDGFELCQAIKTEPRLGHTSVLLLPGTFEHFDEGRAEAVGADGWISKPFESQALLDKVAQLLEADPVRLSTAEEAPVADEVDFSSAEIEEETLEEPIASLGAEVDEVVLGLDEVDELETAADEAPAEEESADDIWDAVSFEEEDLQQADDMSSVLEADLTDEFTATEETAGLAAEETPADFVLAAEDDQPLELTDEVVEEPEQVEPLELAEADVQPLELEEEAIVADDEAGAVPFEESFVPVEEPEGGIDLSTADVAEELPVVEPLEEESFGEDEDVLDLAEDDILEEVQGEELMELEPEPIEEPFSGFSAGVVAEAAVEEEPEESFVLEEETAADEEVEPVGEGLETVPGGLPGAELAPESGFESGLPELEPEVTEDEGFYYEPTESGEDESSVEPSVAGVAGVSAGAAVEAAASVERVEQQLRELSEDELKDVVARVAGPTIEKLANEMLEQIVWEVVPDLAESMIREEIRKIRQGAE